MEQLLPGLTSAPNLHPMVVHFPIAFWVAATGAWSWAVVRKHDDAWRFGRWLHLLGMLGAVVAVGFGFWATEKMGHDTPGHDLVHVHRDLMLVVSGIALVITALAWWRRGATRPWRVGLTLGSLVLLGLMTIGAERGWPPATRQGFDAQTGPTGAFFVGSPNALVEKILAHRENFGITRIALQMGVGIIEHRDMLDAIELLGTKVAPEVRRHAER